MKKTNVVDLSQFKELKEIKNTDESYGSYLKTLGNSQLEGEVNYLLEEFSGNRDFFSRGSLLLREIRSRVHVSVRPKIDKLTDDTLRLL